MTTSTSKPGLESKLKTPTGELIGEVATIGHEIQVLDSNQELIHTTRYCPVTHSVEVYDAKDNLVFEVAPNNSIQITNNSGSSDREWANYFAIQANMIRGLNRQEQRKEVGKIDQNLCLAYNGAYNVLIDAVRGINSGAYMYAEKKGGK
ncbi:MAG: hypothetical protein NTY99_00870 [DPANN group archaeon]|nr:hypothetical protein [DPANN group archaeon]